LIPKQYWGKVINKKISYLIALFTCFILLSVLFSGCINEEQNSEKSKEASLPEVKLDQPSILPDWNDGEYHDYYGTMELLNDFNGKYPYLTNVFSIGESVLGRDIWCIRITNENNNQAKLSCLIDGCIHGNEWEAGEACLYLADYLLTNFDNNKTITNILNSSEIYIIPLVNPDGRQANTRWNDNGIDLNRNFDVDFGRIRGGSFPLGKIFGCIKIPHLPLNPEREFTILHKLFPSFPTWLTNCGRRPFSEPETQAVRDFMRNFENKDFSFYVNCHTATHCIGFPWSVFKPPFEKSRQEQYIFDYVLDWVVENTEYERIDDISVMNYKASGQISDWCFKEFRIPIFEFEILSEDYEPFQGEGKHDHLVHWMETTLPVFMYLLVNIDNLREWRTPDIEPSLPNGVPPPPLN
jgi:hypothetical protein